MIGRGRHFGGGKGIGGGEQIRSYPFASSPHTSEAWLKADKFNAAILSWGKQDMVNLRVTPTAHLAVETGKTSDLLERRHLQVAVASRGLHLRRPERPDLHQRPARRSLPHSRAGRD